METPKGTPGLRLTVLLVLVLVALSTVLIALRLEQVLLALARERGLHVAYHLRGELESELRRGTPAGRWKLDDHIGRYEALDPSLLAAGLELPSGSARSERYASDTSLLLLNPAWTQQLLAGATGGAHAHVARDIDHRAFIGVPVADPTGRRVAALWLVYDRKILRDTGRQTLEALLPWAGGAAAALMAVLCAVVAWWSRVPRRRLALAAQAVATDTDEGRARGPAEIVAMVESGRGWRAGFWHEALLIGGAFVLAMAAVGTLAWKARELARPMLLAQVDQNAWAVLEAARAQVDQGLSGIEPRLVAELAPASGMAFLAVQQAGGALVAFASRDGLKAGAADVRAALQGQPQAAFRLLEQDLSAPGAQGGKLVAAISLDQLRRSATALLLDLMLALVVSAVLVRELLAGLWERSLLKPYLAFENAWQLWRARARQLADGSEAARLRALDWLGEVRGGVRRLAEQVQARLRSEPLPGVGAQLVRLRLIVFLTALSEEVLRPFFAVFASEVTPPLPGLSPTLLAGLPVACFMLTLALAQPLGPWLTRRFDIRRSLFWMTALGGVLMGMTALTNHGLPLLALRAGSGVAHGLVLILCQTTIVRITDYGQRARGLVEVSAAVVAAGVCGPSLGGLLVDRFGTLVAFAACAACLLAAAAMSLRITPLPAGARANLATLGGWRGTAAVLRQHHVAVAMWFCAVPARLAAAALLVVVTPLYLVELGTPATIAGEVLMLYFLAFMASAPWVARRSDRSRRRKPWVAAGCALSAVACLAFPLVGGVAGAAIACALLGVGQALLSGPVIALVTEAFDRDPHATQIVGATPEQALAAFRFIERFGSIAAPFAAAACVALFGLPGAIGAIGLVLGAGAVAVYIGLARYKETGQR